MTLWHRAWHLVMLIWVDDGRIVTAWMCLVALCFQPHHSAKLAQPPPSTLSPESTHCGSSSLRPLHFGLAAISGPRIQGKTMLIECGPATRGSEIWGIRLGYLEKGLPFLPRALSPRQMKPGTVCANTSIGPLAVGRRRQDRS